MNLLNFPCMAILHTYLYASQHFSHLSTSQIHCVIHSAQRILPVFRQDSATCVIWSLLGMDVGSNINPSKIKRKKLHISHCFLCQWKHFALYHMYIIALTSALKVRCPFAVLLCISNISHYCQFLSLKKESSFKCLLSNWQQCKFIGARFWAKPLIFESWRHNIAQLDIEHLECSSHHLLCSLCQYGHMPLWKGHEFKLSEGNRSVPCLCYFPIIDLAFGFSVVGSGGYFFVCFLFVLFLKIISQKYILCYAAEKKPCLVLW